MWNYCCPTASGVDVSIIIEPQVTGQGYYPLYIQGINEVKFLRYTVCNNGPETATGIVADAIFPVDATFFPGAVAPSQGTWAADVWTVGTLASGACATLDMNFAMPFPSGAFTPLSWVGNITAVNETDTNPANNNFTYNMITTTHDIDYTFCVTETSVGPYSAGANTPIQYTVTVTNNDGALTALHVPVSALLPTEVTYTSHVFSAGGGQYTTAGPTAGQVFFTSIAPGATETITINGTVNTAGLGVSFTALSAFLDPAGTIYPVNDQNNGDNSCTVVVNILP